MFNCNVVNVNWMEGVNYKCEFIMSKRSYLVAHHVLNDEVLKNELFSGVYGLSWVPFMELHA